MPGNFHKVIRLLKENIYSVWFDVAVKIHRTEVFLLLLDNDEQVLGILHGMYPNSHDKPSQ